MVALHEVAGRHDGNNFSGFINAHQALVALSWEIFDKGKENFVSALELRIGNRAAYFRKAICTPDFTSDRVLARDAFQFAELWLKRNCTEALPYWSQAHVYYLASQDLPAHSAPLTSYYCFLNAVKALLIVKGQAFSERHGVTGTFKASKRALRNENIRISGVGVIGALSTYLKEGGGSDHTLTEILSNLPFIHRAFRFTFKSHPELFIPLRNVVYRKHPTSDYIWVSATIEGRFADNRSLRTLPAGFEKDDGYTDRCVIRTTQRVRWFGRNASRAEQEAALPRLHAYHRLHRRHLVFISASPDLWYLKREVSGATRLNRYSMTLIFAAMHRLSELSRYDPKALMRYLDGKENWLLTEFIELAPAQFIDEVVCEMTSLEFALPGIRPRST